MRFKIEICSIGAVFQRDICSHGLQVITKIIYHHLLVWDKKNSREFDFSILRVYLCPIIKFPNLDVFAALKCAQGLNSNVLKEVRKMCEKV